MLKNITIKKGDILEKEKMISWFKTKYLLIKQATISAHLHKLSISSSSRIHLNVDPNGKDDLFFQIDNKKFRLYEQASDPTPIYFRQKEDEKLAAKHQDSEEENGNEFAYEKDLQNFLAKNLSLIEPGLSLYLEEEISGIEFPVGNRFIDFLAIDNNKNYVVIELKVSRGYDRVVGQILRYMAWIRKHHAEEGRKVRGIIIAREISDDLLLACSEMNNVELYEYNL